MKKNWLILIGLGATAFFAYRQLKRTQTVIVNTPIPGTANNYDTVA